MTYLLMEDEFVESVMEAARDTLSKLGLMTAVLFLEFEDGTFDTADLSMADTYGKRELVMRHIPDMVPEGETIVCAGLLSESWLSESEKHMPSEDPDRREGLVYFGRSADGEAHVLAKQEFGRNAHDQLWWADLTIEREDEFRANSVLDYLFEDGKEKVQDDNDWN